MRNKKNEVLVIDVLTLQDIVFENILSNEQIDQDNTKRISRIYSLVCNAKYVHCFVFSRVPQLMRIEMSPLKASGLGDLTIFSCP